jgi:hypothetical protein
LLSRKPVQCTAVAAALAGLVAAGCGTGATPLPTPPPVGVGPRFHPPPLSAAVRAARPVGALRCGGAGIRVGVHLEVFLDRQVVIVPPGIGIAPPQRRSGAYVTGGRCSYPLRTREPTGVIEAAPGPRYVLGDFFAVWGQSLSPRSLLGVRGRVLAFVGGKRWPGDPRRIPLTRHAEIVVEVGGYVKPHAGYLFPPGL